MIVPEEIRQSIDHLSSLSFEEQRRLLRRLKQIQGPLLIYSAGSAERDLNSEEADILLFMAMVCWFCISQKVPSLRTINNDQLKSVEARVRTEMRSFRMSESRIEKMLAKESQPNLISYVVETILQSDHIRKESRAAILQYMKIVTDCLLESASASEAAGGTNG